MPNNVNRPQQPSTDHASRWRPLSRIRILRAALKLVDREGASALTMRRLADHLDSGTMSLYHYVPDREALLDGLGELLVRQVKVATTDVGWDDALRQFIRGIRTVALAHPQAFQLVGMRPLGTPDALPPIEALLRRGAQEGRDPIQSFYAYRTAAAFARGFALTEILGLTLETQPGERATAAGIDANRFPHLAHAVNDPATRDHDAAFESGLDATVRGLSI